MDQKKITQKYIDHVLDHGKAPVSVRAFAKSLKISERAFFEHFASFEVIEKHIWKDLVLDVVENIEAGEEWESFSAHQRFLTFHYALCDSILNHRSFFLLRFPKKAHGCEHRQALRGMRHAFEAFTKRIVSIGIESGEIAERGPITNAYHKAWFVHLLSVIHFNLHDESKGFERTDAFIEKSVRLSFDLVGKQALDSAFDLVRFLRGRAHNH